MPLRLGFSNIPSATMARIVYAFVLFPLWFNRSGNIRPGNNYELVLSWEYFSMSVCSMAMSTAICKAGSATRTPFFPQTQTNFRKMWSASIIAGIYLSPWYCLGLAPGRGSGRRRSQRVEGQDFRVHVYFPDCQWDGEMGKIDPNVLVLDAMMSQ